MIVPLAQKQLVSAVGDTLMLMYARCHTKLS